MRSLFEFRVGRRGCCPLTLSGPERTHRFHRRRGRDAHGLRRLRCASPGHPNSTYRAWVFCMSWCNLTLGSGGSRSLLPRQVERQLWADRLTALPLRDQGAEVLGALPHSMDCPPKRWPESPRTAVQRANRASNRPNHLGLRCNALPEHQNGPDHLGLRALQLLDALRLTIRAQSPMMA